MIALETGTHYPLHPYFAINVLFELLGNNDIADKLDKRCGFRYIDFIKLTGKHDLFNITKLAERDRQLAERDRQLAEQQIINQRMFNSVSWRITAPLRYVYDHISPVYRYVRGKGSSE